MRRWWELLIVISIALLLGATVGMRAKSEETGGELYGGNVWQAVGRMVKRLPEVWQLQKEAEALLPALQDFPTEVEVPPEEMIYSWLTDFCSTPHRRPGTEEGHRAEQWVAEKFQEFGLENVSLEPVPITVWTAHKWSLTVEGEEIPSFYVVNSGFTKEEGVTAELVYVGEGRAADFARQEVKDKIVVADVPFPYLPTGFLLRSLNAAYLISNPDRSLTLRSGQYLNFVRMNFLGGTDLTTAPDNDVYWNAVKAGAAAICLILRDQPSNYNTHYGPYDGIMKPLPGLWIGKKDGQRLRHLARRHASATLTILGSKEPGVMHNVWGMLPGMTDQVILVTSHHDAPFTGASEDGTGTVQVLAQAWAWSKLPREQRPKTLVFVVDAGHFYGSLGAHAFAREHKDIMERTTLLLTLEHLAAKEVREHAGDYEPTGKLALTVMFTSPQARLIAGLTKALEKKPPKRVAAIPSDFFGKAPTSDAAGYVLEANPPVISWIGCPYYLLDSGDTLDKIAVEELNPIAQTVAEIIKVFMMME